jgi:hypothetical protein
LPAALKLPNPTKPPQPVEIEWLDAAIHPSFDGPAGESPGRMTLRTVGFYCRKTAKEITVASDLDPATNDVRTTHVISRRDIVRLTWLSPEPIDG